METLYDELGEIAYRAYGESVSWRNYQGLTMPSWPDLGEPIRGGWKAAAQAVADRVLRIVEDE